MPDNIKFGDLLKRIETSPSKKSSQVSHFNSIGVTGVRNFGGVYDIDHIQSLEHIQGIKKFKEMARSDDQIEMLVNVVKNPILSAKHFIEPVDDTDQEKNIADFISHVLFEDIGNPQTGKFKTWDNYIEECLTFVEFGYVVHEVVNKVVLKHPVWGDYIGLKDLGWRDPETLDRFNLSEIDGSLLSVTQIPSGSFGNTVDIPGKFILNMALKKWGDNYVGESKLRPLYGNWFRKQVLHKVKMIGAERASVGLLIGKIKQGLENTAEAEAFKSIITQLVVHQRMGATINDNFSIDNLKIDFDGDKLQKLIDSENIGMSKSFLAGFMELGLTGSSGSFALGTDLSDIFLGGLEKYAKLITNNVQHRLVKKLVDVNFGKREKYPLYKITGINDKAGKELADIVVSLADAGLLQKGERLTTHLHKAYSLPETVDVNEFVSNELAPDPDPNLNPNPEEVVLDPAKPVAPIIKPGDPIPPKPVPEQKRIQEQIKLAEPSDAGKDIKKSREALKELMVRDLSFRSDQYIKNVLKKFEKDKSRTDVLETAIPGQKRYKDMLVNFLAPLSIQASKDAVKELGLSKEDFADSEEFKKLPKITRDQIKTQVDLLVNSQDADLQKAVLFPFNRKIGDTDSLDKLAEDMKVSAARYIKGVQVATAAGNTASFAVNTSRNNLFGSEQGLEASESFVITNPAPVAKICQNLAGRVITKEEFLTGDLPPWHHNCDSFVRVQRVNKKGNKAVDPRGLTPDPTDSEGTLTQILNSKTF